MYLLMTDETNITPDETIKFFAYGGLVIPLDSVVPIDSAITLIRQKAGYYKEDEFKFDTRSRPEQVSIKSSTEAKKSVIDLCIREKCKFIVYIIHHQIARHQPIQNIISWGANCVIGRFNHFLFMNDDYGLCLMDRLSDTSEYSYLTQKFCKGLEFPGESDTSLDRIKLFGSTCINASHLSSAMDIVLGSFRYCINRPQNRKAASEMMAQVTRLLWHTRIGEDIYATDKGLIIRPKEIKVQLYKDEYKELIDHINLLLKDMNI